MAIENFTLIMLSTGAQLTVKEDAKEVQRLLEVALMSNKGVKLTNLGNNHVWLSARACGEVLVVAQEQHDPVAAKIAAARAAGAGIPMPSGFPS